LIIARAAALIAVAGRVSLPGTHKPSPGSDTRNYGIRVNKGDYF